jgi:hypothetical protein
MSTWEYGNELEVITNKIDCLGKVVELVAEKLSSDVESGALWAVVDALQLQISKLEEISNDLCAFTVEDDLEELNEKSLIEIIKKALQEADEHDE